MKKMILITGLVLVGALSATAVIATAEETATPTTVTTPTPTPTPSEVATPTPTPSLSVSKMSEHPQMSLTKEQWEAGGFTNPYTTDEESGYEPNAHINPGPGLGASKEEVNAWWMARVENCKTLTEHKKYIDCMWRPWVYGF